MQLTGGGVSYIIYLSVMYARSFTGFGNAVIIRQEEDAIARILIYYLIGGKMKEVSDVKQFFVSHATLVKTAVIVLLALLFAGSILIVVFAGGEFASDADATEIKGIMRLTEAKYSSSYFSGDKFSFDKENSEVMLLAKDPAIENVVKIDDLPAPEYGFRITGQEQIYTDPSEIVMSEGITSIDVVSVRYPTVYTSVGVSVIGSVDSSKLTAETTFEAETANLYKGEELLTQEQKATLPDAEKPYLSNAGTAENIKGQDCSGGACLRNFASGMKIEFKFISTESTEIELEMLVCKRPQESAFDDGYIMKINGEEFTTGFTVPSGGTGNYFAPYTLPGVTIAVQRGLNVLTFEYNKTSPHNFDAIKLYADNSIIGGLDAIVSANS